MQQTLRPYATTGIALVGAGLIAVTPVAPPPSAVQVRPVQLVDITYAELITNTLANLNNISSGADLQAISGVFSALLTNPLGVIGAFTNTTPDVTTDLTSLPATISVQLPPGLELAIAGLGSQVATDNAIQQVIAGASSGDLGALINGLPTILNGYLNGQDNISLLDGTITIPAYNGVLAPLQTAHVDLSLTNLLDALGLGNTPLTNLDLTSLLNQLGLGDLTLGSLFKDLGLSGDGLGDLLKSGSGITSLGGLLNLLGLNNLGSGSGITLTLTNILHGLGLDTNVNLSSLTLGSVLTDFGLNPTADVGLVGFLNGVGLSSLTGEGLGTLLSSLTGSPDLSTVVSSIVTSLLSNTTLGPLISAIPGISTALNTALTAGLEGDLNTVTVGQLLGGQTLNDNLAAILTALGVDGAKVPSTLTIGTLLSDLGFSGATGNLTLGGLLSDLGNPFGALNITDLLNSLNLGDLLNTLDLSNLPLNLSNLGDLSGLTLGGLLGDLGLGDVANISVDPFGGAVTELVDVVPQQILAALG